MKRGTLAMLAVLASCGTTAGDSADVALFGAGSASNVAVVGAYTIALHRADVAFGPAYFCETAETSTELCAQAVIETTDAHAFDALDPNPQPLGELTGVTGSIASVQYDLGLSFLLTGSAPTALPGSIDGHSLVLEGTATDGVTSFDFVAAIDVTSSVAGSTAILGAATAVTIPASGASLTIGLDPRALLAGVDWAGVATTPHAAGAPIVVAPGTVAYAAIASALASGSAITFAWTLP